MEIDLAQEENAAGVTVRVAVRMSGRETSRLFVAGDRLIQLPLEGALADRQTTPIPRTSIFLSELAAGGLARTFANVAAAEAFATSIRAQLATPLEDV